jgi:1-phosphofructokinase family hexose kinase
MHLCLGTTPTVQQTMIYERVAADEVNRAVEVRRGASGKPINVARILHTLGAAAMLCVPLGSDTGQFITRELQDAGIPHDCVEVSRPTRTCVTIIDRAADTATEFVEEAQPLDSEEGKLMLRKLRAHLRRAKMVILSGTLAAGVSGDFYADCCVAAKKSGVPVILDAKGEALLRALPMNPLLVKPNRAELAGTLGAKLDTDASLREAMIALARKGAQWVAVTMGREGAALCDGSRFWKLPVVEVDAISPIGSGDAFAARVAAAVVEGKEMPEACRLGSACAAANTLIPGSGMLRLEDVRRLEPRARIEKWT